MTFAFYIITSLLVFFAITQILQSFVGGLIGRFTNLLLGMFLGSLVTWLIIDFLWILIEKGHIPILSLGINILILFVHANIEFKKLTKVSKKMIVAEIWAIISYGIILMIVFRPIRWI